MQVERLNNNRRQQKQVVRDLIQKKIIFKKIYKICYCRLKVMKNCDGLREAKHAKGG